MKLFPSLPGAYCDGIEEESLLEAKRELSGEAAMFLKASGFLEGIKSIG
jgi:hypothetical protein